ncbi:MAG: Fe-S cluster assembly protein SufD [Chloroflexota bacterium]
MPGELLSAPRLALSRETVEELSHTRQEPAWLRAVRLRGLEAFERTPMPDQRTEGWRRTSLRGLPLQDIDPLAAGARRHLNGGPSGAEVLAQQAGASALAFRNGTATPGPLPDGARAVDLREALEDPLLAARIEKHFATVVLPESDKFVALHYAFFNAGLVVFVPRGTRLERPIWVSHAYAEPALVHTLVIADEGSEVSLVEEYRGGSNVASGVVEQVVGPNAHVRYVQLQRWAPEVWSFSWQRAHLAQDASLRTLNVALGARLARNTVQVVLEGRGSQADVLGVVDGHGRQYVDFQTLQEHSGNATRSDLIIHNALRDQSSANFTGLIRINTSAHQTESSQEQKNILLSERSKADSDPKLEILNNDVIRCTHGAAVGPVDQEMLFYLESRGLDRAAAEQLIVEGFFQSTLRKLGLPRVEEALWSAIAEHEIRAEAGNA